MLCSDGIAILMFNKYVLYSIDMECNGFVGKFSGRAQFSINFIMLEIYRNKVRNEAVFRAYSFMLIFLGTALRVLHLAKLVL